MPKDLDQTMHFRLNNQGKDRILQVLDHVYQALKEKGYDPSNQIMGYIISGDPTYITSYNDARKLIKQIDRNDLLENVLNFYFEKNHIN